MQNCSKLTKPIDGYPEPSQDGEIAMGRVRDWTGNIYRRTVTVKVVKV